jgi:hypothetical protein
LTLSAQAASNFRDDEERPIAFESFMQGFTDAGLLGGSKMPGGVERIFEETTKLEDSEFADLFLVTRDVSIRAPKES